MKYIFYLLSVTLVLVLAGTNGLQAQAKLPNVVPPSPQSKAIQIYGEIPVSYNNGIPDISIPLHTAKSGDIEVPIVLRYYASGIKPRELNQSNIGAGWILDVGGLVSRNVEGRADELFPKPSPFLSAFEINQDNYDHILYLTDIVSNRKKDAQFDRFSYTINNKHGNFSIEDDGTGQFKAYSYPFVPYDIKVQTGPPVNSLYYKSITGIDITDDNGIGYKFGHSNVEKAIVNADEAPTGWYLEEISDVSGTNKVLFAYEDIPTFQFINTEGSVEIRSNNVPGDNGVPVNGSCDGGGETYSGYCDIQGQGITYQTKNIKRILLKDGSIDFNLSTSKKYIESIVIKDSKNEIIKSIVFNRDNFPGSNALLRLKSVVISGAASSVNEQYSFSYNEQHPVADNRCLIDQWGFCRGESDNTAVCERRSIEVIQRRGTNTQPSRQIITVGDADFSPNEDYMKRYILEKITYPTGGTTQFDYETNKYVESPGNIKPGGGLRIRKIISDNNAGSIMSKTYDYEPGYIDYDLDNEMNFSTCRFVFQFTCLAVDLFTQYYYVYRNRSLSNGWNKSLGPNNVYYTRVTEYFGDTTVNTGKNIYYYSYDNPNMLSPTNIGGGIKGQYVPNYYNKVCRNWSNGLLKKKEVFNHSLNGSYQVLEDVSYNYGFVDLKTLNGLYIFQVASYSGYTNDPLGTYNARSNYATQHTIGSMGDLIPGSSINDQSLVTGVNYLQSEINHKYVGNDTLTTTTVYGYNNPRHYYPTSITRYLSNGDTSLTTLAYVDEFSSIAPYNTMKTRNIISSVIEKKEYLKPFTGLTRLVKSEKNNWKAWPEGVFKPVSMQLSTWSAPLENRLEFDKYDSSGNILQMKQSNNVTECYFYGYKNQYPVARVVGADYVTAKNYVDQSILNDPQNDQQLRNELNKLRVALPGAMVTTYTFKPIVGVTSETDASGRTIYYEYDLSGRLKVVKDQNGKILKQFNYQYQQPVTQ
ncbi:hypothetical protein ACTJJ0_13070 [Chitinophaga sp. 22321]|uniref:YD repeat-containing protein n=1 Tax=Chitinophaga hostae TaxID=2831022 RepID=A0ABS5J368_9BACT|nr:hypothetical protein [Chitinophaga hostae]MBS0028872.1 hypothetical protein [Chitinophaga hostae]